MGSESNAKDFEVKKARTRTRSKMKQETDEDIPLNQSTTNVEKSSNGIRSPVKTRSRRLLTSATNEPEGGAENSETANTEEVKKTRQRKRTPNRKRRSEEAANTKESVPKKISKESPEAADNEAEVDDEEGSTNETKKPKKPSKRQVKREKAEQRETMKREAGRLEATEKALNYVSKWKHAKSEWKFEKLRQIWLMDNLLDDELIPDDIFPTVLEYFEGCKGMAREQLLKKGMDVIKKREETDEKATDGDEEMTESVEYRRARQLLQALPTET